jgi:hypothetical protein
MIGYIFHLEIFYTFSLKIENLNFGFVNTKLTKKMRRGLSLWVVVVVWLFPIELRSNSHPKPSPISSEHSDALFDKSWHLISTNQVPEGEEIWLSLYDLMMM